MRVKSEVFAVSSRRAVGYSFLLALATCLAMALCFPLETRAQAQNGA